MEVEIVLLWAVFSENRSDICSVDSSDDDNR